MDTNWQKAACAWMSCTALALALAVDVGLPAWALILVVTASFLPVVAVGFWLIFDNGIPERAERPPVVTIEPESRQIVAMIEAPSLEGEVL